MLPLVANLLSHENYKNPSCGGTYIFFLPFTKFSHYTVSGFNGAVLQISNVLFRLLYIPCATATVHAKGRSTIFLACTALAALMYMQQLKDNEISEIHTMYNCMSLAGEHSYGNHIGQSECHV